MENPPYNPALLCEDKQFVLKKFGLTSDAFAAILNAPPKQAQDYPNHRFLFHTLAPLKNVFRRIATSS
jgi:hypothetical protein